MAQAILIAIGSFLPMLVMLVVIHELGHYFTAKWLGVKVLEFGVGYPPRAFGIYTGKTKVLLTEETQLINLPNANLLNVGSLVRIYSESTPEGLLIAKAILVQGANGKFPSNPELTLSNTNLLQHEGKIKSAAIDHLIISDMLYSLNWTPLGGFVRLAGENDPSIPQSLASKSPLSRAIILVAGSVMNAIFPIVVFAILFMIPHDTVTGNVIISDISPDSPAAMSGLTPGDHIVSTDGKMIKSTSDLIQSITFNAGSEMEWIVSRGGSPVSILITPRVDPPEGQGATGIRIELANTVTTKQFHPPWTALALGATSTWDMLVLMKQEISRWISGTANPEFSGPIGIAQITGEITTQGGARGWLMLSILISINLAILNILPIPMLDGGRLLFVIIEWVRRGKRIPAEKEGLVHIIGFAALIALVILVSANDINRLLQGGSLLGS
ncbi:MAG: RIP metalloprotease RseP [Chloroflexi bacterium]|nr:RIP metalloprotease RseP [Chloroflexota bacterium]|tara:strand:- start:379 stop:1704 length:1326 start_codon:yes stop_codon:yes gene_type:complete